MGWARRESGPARQAAARLAPARAAPAVPAAARRSSEGASGVVVGVPIQPAVRSEQGATATVRWAYLTARSTRRLRLGRLCCRASTCAPRERRRHRPSPRPSTARAGRRPGACRARRRCRGRASGSRSCAASCAAAAAVPAPTSRSRGLELRVNSAPASCLSCTSFSVVRLAHPRLERRQVARTQCRCEHGLIARGLHARASRQLKQM
jgi:hypothetical protein